MQELPQTLQSNLHALGYRTLTEIQETCLQVIPTGTDVLARSPTGTGKTAAFLLPLLARMLVQPGTKALVLEPSRELVIQCANECRKLCAGTSIRVVAAYGGTDSARQEHLIAAGAQVIVGTTGRVSEFLQKGILKPSEYAILVLDEADRLLSTQFEKETTHIASRMSKERQTLLFCVQMPSNVLEKASNILKKEYATIKAGIVAGHSVKHDFITTHEKTRVLASLLRRYNVKSLVFCNTADEVKKLKKDLAYHGVHAQALHSSLRSDERQKITHSFSVAHTGVLIATDLASRGVHVPGIRRVYSFDVPEKPEWYIHRAGRTGRMGEKGECTSIILPSEIKKLKNVLSACGIEAKEGR